MNTTKSIYPPVVTFRQKGQERKMSMINFLNQTTLFADLLQRELQAIAKDMRPRHYKPGDIIFHEGDPGQVLYLIKSGQIRIFVNGLAGSQTNVILFGRPGDIFGELAVIDGLPRSATAAALHNTTLYTMQRDQFRYHMRQCPQLSLNFMKVLSSRVRYNTLQVDSLATLPVPQRLARKLLELAHEVGIVQQDGVRIKMTQTNLASTIGATRESVNKSLKEFRESDWITTKPGYITIVDPEALRVLVST
ncbi:MAG: Crp/Fnr family transcriptional regulator [Chloroflexi bacterium]|nr:Crp/Fnr family transcriptional regulator [Chloroflexota bacterium]